MAGKVPVCVSTNGYTVLDKLSKNALMDLAVTFAMMSGGVEQTEREVLALIEQAWMKLAPKRKDKAIGLLSSYDDLERYTAAAKAIDGKVMRLDEFAAFLLNGKMTVIDIRPERSSPIDLSEWYGRGESCLPEDAATRLSLWDRIGTVKLTSIGSVNWLMNDDQEAKGSCGQNVKYVCASGIAKP